jgi:ADP-dependent NAD(P)H-hydrate dehydratase / NAD(P)H-hydrate epimerase
VREFDRLAIAVFSLNSYALMCQAAADAYGLLKQRWPDCRQIVVCCGPGNNAGDGYVLARLAHVAGYDVNVVVVTPIARLRGAAKQAYEDAVTAGVRLVSDNLWPDGDVWIDALLGSGVTQPVRGPCQQAILRINQAAEQGRGVLAMDMPSGLNADTGMALGTAVRAQVTVTFIALKQGLFTASGRDYCGDIYCSDLDLPHKLWSYLSPSAHLMTTPTWSVRLKNSHKGDYGRVLLAGGATGMLGAIQLAAEAALRSGAGLVQVATDARHTLGMTHRQPELMTVAAEELDFNSIESATVIALGPGLGQKTWGEGLYQRLVKKKVAKVMDADALNWLARYPQQQSQWVLTPHPKEAARLLSCKVTDIQADRFSAVKAIQQRYGGVCVLKGAGTLVFDGHQLWVCPWGNPGMSSGGMGDVLTGIVAALIAQKFSLTEAALRAVWVHAVVADQLTVSGERGLLASDLLPHLRGYMATKRVREV